MKLLKIGAFFFALILSFSGCGNNFEWFPKNGAFSNNTTADNQSNGSSTGTSPGTVMREFPFPSLPFPSNPNNPLIKPYTITRVSDIAFDSNSNVFWMLAEITNSPANIPTVLVQMNAVTGAYIGVLSASSWPSTIVYGSTFATDGSNFWITSNGNKSGVVASEVYWAFTSSSTVQYGSTYNCPATSRGFCQGLAFDPTTSSYWSAGSDNTTLTNYNVASGSVTSSKPYSNLWSTNGVSDLAFDSVTGEVLVVKDGIIRVSKSSGAILGTIPFTLPGTGRGDWDGTYFWVVDNSSKSIKALFVR